MKHATSIRLTVAAAIVAIASTAQAGSKLEKVHMVAEGIDLKPAILRANSNGYTTYENSSHTYLLRLVDAPQTPLDFPKHILNISRGPFTTAADTARLRAHNIDLIVAKNSGGKGAYAKIEAARHLGLPVVMVSRPHLPDRLETDQPEAVLDWLIQPLTERGV